MAESIPNLAQKVNFDSSSIKHFYILFFKGQIQ